jgi:DNA primase
VTPLERIRSSVSIEAVIGAHIPLKRVAGVLKGCCPFHGEKTPSFVVYRDSFHCFGCGAHGDAVDYVMKVEKCSYRRAFEILGDESELKAACAPKPQDDGTEKRLREIAKSAYIWATSKAIEPDGPAAQYLAHRGIPSFIRSKALRFNASTYHPDRSTYPAMIGNIQGIDGATIGVHRTYLTMDGRKAASEPQKAVKGTHMGGAVRLHPPGSTLIVAEGLETAASAALIFRLPSWSAVSSQNMARVLALPAEVTDVVIAADHDGPKLMPNGEAIDPGLHAARKAKQRWNMEGRIVRIFCPIEPKADFNDLWMSGKTTEYKEIL